MVQKSYTSSHLLGPISIPSAAGPTGPSGPIPPPPGPTGPRPGPSGPLAAPSFSTIGTINLGNSNDLFVKLAYSAPFGLSAVDAFITSLVSKSFINNFEPTYFQIPYIYSAADNLVNGKYTSSSVTDGSKLITTYIIPYKSELGQKFVTIVTYLDQITNILFYEIPREFSYNSKDQASVAVTPSGSDYVGKISIPSTFISNIDKPFYYKVVDYSIKVDAVPNYAGTGSQGTITVQDSVSYSLCCSSCNDGAGQCFTYTGTGNATIEQAQAFCINKGCTF